MTATVTGAATGRTTATGSPAPARRTPRRRRFRLPRASTTPGQVRLIRAGLVVLCLGWGALAALMVGSYVEVASEEMHQTLLPAARDVYARENSRLAAASAQATGLPLAVVALAGGLVVGYFLYRSQRWLSQRTHRTLNVGLLLASFAGAVALIWLVVALAGGRGLSLRLAEYR